LGSNDLAAKKDRSLITV